MINRKENISRYSNDTSERVSLDFSKIKLGLKNLEDAVVSLGNYKKANSTLSNKQIVLQAINDNNLEKMREISNFFFRVSGIYSRLCRHFAYLYRYDWFMIPYIKDEKVKKDKLIKDFSDALTYLDNFQIKNFLGEVALKVIKNGCYYGYIIEDTGLNTASIQELPAKYCRSRFTVGGRPAVEFNMKFFDDCYRDVDQRMRMLSLFPNDFKKGYVAYKEGKLVPDYPGDTSGWYLLDTKYSIKFNMNGEDYPFFISTIPAIIDLDAAQDLDRKKMLQQLLKIIIQKMPIDKNGDLVFDPDEAQELHNNVVKMLGDAIGVDVLTTFADVDVADMADKSSVTSVDELEKVERTVYNESGTAQNLFNTDGNIALEKSILNDEAATYNLLLQFERFLNDLIVSFNKRNKKVVFKVQILNTTIYNYKDLAKTYKEQAQMGYSKLLPQIALGQSQSAILASAYFENEVLDLVQMFVPPVTSNQMNSDVLKKGGSSNSNPTTKTDNGEKGEVGRKEKANDEKSEKTIKNRESMN